MGHQIVVIFDLDDTLYAEMDYLRSAFREIASEISLNLAHLKSVSVT